MIAAGDASLGDGPGATIVGGLMLVAFGAGGIGAFVALGLGAIVFGIGWLLLSLL